MRSLEIVMIVIVFLFTIFLTGCTTLYVTGDGQPFMVKEGSVFATPEQLHKLSDGEKIPVENPVVGKYYLPNEFIIIENGEVRLKTVKDEE